MKIKYDYPWCASPLSGLVQKGRLKVYALLVKNSQPLKANAQLFSSN